MTALAEIVAELPHRWVPIAERPRTAVGFLPPWQPVPLVPLTIREAHELVDAGALILMCKHWPDKITAMVRPPPETIPADKQPLRPSAFRFL